MESIVLSFCFGAALGLFLQRSRFCFFCVTRDFIDTRDASGLLGILAALAVGTIGYHLVFGLFVPDPGTGRLPPDAHIGPVSWALALAALVFGAGMSLSGSCISAHLYRLGEGAIGSVIALIGVLVGFGLGFMTWNSLYLASIDKAPVIWLPGLLGYSGSIVAQIVVLGGLAIFLMARHVPAAELGSLARTAGGRVDLLPERLQGLDGFAGCATAIKETVLSENGALILGLVLASFTSELFARDFQPQPVNAAKALGNLFGGILMGWGAMTALGCTVGTLLSGIMAAAMSGWVFAFFCLLGLWLTWRLQRALAK